MVNRESGTSREVQAEAQEEQESQERMSQANHEQAAAHMAEVHRRAAEASAESVGDPDRIRMIREDIEAIQGEKPKEDVIDKTDKVFDRTKEVTKEVASDAWFATKDSWFLAKPIGKFLHNRGKEVARWPQAIANAGYNGIVSGFAKLENWLNRKAGFLSFLMPKPGEPHLEKSDRAIFKEAQAEKEKKQEEARLAPLKEAAQVEKGLKEDKPATEKKKKK